MCRRQCAESSGPKVGLLRALSTGTRAENWRRTSASEGTRENVALPHAVSASRPLPSSQSPATCNLRSSAAGLWRWLVRSTPLAAPNACQSAHLAAPQQWPGRREQSGPIVGRRCAPAARRCTSFGGAPRLPAPPKTVSSSDHCLLCSREANLPAGQICTKPARLASGLLPPSCRLPFAFRLLPLASLPFTSVLVFLRGLGPALSSRRIFHFFPSLSPILDSSDSANSFPQMARELALLVCEMENCATVQKGHHSLAKLVHLSRSSCSLWAQN